MSLNWRPEWLTPYESPWSVIEKIKYANRVTTREFLKAFGTIEVSNIKSGFIGKRNRDLWGMAGLDDKHLSHEIGFSLAKHNEAYITEITRMFPLHISRKSLFREDLTYCDECLKSGYHSLLHQFALIYKCPFHGCELTKSCKYCGATIPYAMPNHNVDSGFFCECGNCFTEKLRDFKEIRFDLANQNIFNWLHNKDNNFTQLHNSYIFRPGLFNDKDALLHLFKICDGSTITHQIITRKKTHDNYTSSEYDDFYENIRQVLKSIERQLFQTILKNHKHCIKRFTGLVKKSGEDFPPICPYAYAYVFWRDTFLNLNPFYNEPGPIIKHNLRNFEIPVYAYRDELENLLMFVINKENISLVNINWIMAHIIASLAKFHFLQWLILARQFSSQKIRPVQKYEQFSDQVPFIAFVFTQDNKIHYFCWEKENVNFNISLECPYEDKRFKKIHKDEVSHLPMRLAINPGNNEEKRAAEKYLANLKIISTIR